MIDEQSSGIINRPASDEKVRSTFRSPNVEVVKQEATK